MRILLFLLLVLPAVALPAAGQQPEAERLFARFKAAASFDYHYPREQVYLHLDNNAYFEGDTIWFKAYVVRAALLRPTDLSHVLYVELLDADGRLREQKLLEIDSLGQADGDFSLALPIKNGFYEIRAYTREMVNWGTEACFSRVVPVFVKPKQRDSDILKADIVPDVLSVKRPEEERHLVPGHPRPFNMDKPKDYHLDFFPEGGNRVAGASQRIAFRLTNGRGQTLTDTLRLFSGEGQEVAAFDPEHEGMGMFTLPAEADAWYVVAGRGKNERRFDLPAPEPAAAYTLSAYGEEEGVSLIMATAPWQAAQAQPLLGLAVLCRDQVCYFDTLSVGPEGVEYFIPRQSLRGGVNRIELFDAEGRSLCRRLVWNNPPDNDLRLSVRQNEKEYMPFSPIALEMSLADADGKPVSTTFSLAVRDAGGEILKDAGDSYATFLLGSEVKGYIHHPEFYFAADDERHRRALDLLLMVQGWTANSFEVMCRRDSFLLKQPIEDKLTLNGQVFKYDKKTKPMPGIKLGIKMYSLDGGALEGQAVTDSLGRFAFASNVNYTGQWIAQITTKTEKDKRRWSSVALDRWFMPPPRKYDFREMELEAWQPRLEKEERAAQVETFAWTDTIPRRISRTLPPAKVIGRKYKGFTGNRFSYGGGEDNLKRSADHFYNIEMEVERKKDRGEAVGLVWDLLHELNKEFYFTASDGDTGYYLYYRDRSLGGGGETMAEEVKSAAIIEPGNRYHPTHTTQLSAEAAASKVGITDDSPTLRGENDASIGKFAKLERRAKESAQDALGPDLDRNTVGAVSYYGEPISGAHVLIYMRPDFYRFKTKRGVDKRIVSGFAKPKKFYSPNYRNAELPDESDVRRTLYWNPSVRTDAQGRASAVFFSNSRAGQQLRISARGISASGAFLGYER